LRLSVQHTTRHAYAAPVIHGLQRLRLRPKPTHGQQVLEWEMRLEGAVPQAEYEDQHHNSTALVLVEPGVRELVISCSAVVETVGNSGIIGQHSGNMPLWCFLRQTRLTRPGPKLRTLVASLGANSGGDRADQLALLHALSDAVGDAVRYEAGQTDVATSAEEALAVGRGVCQDHAHIFISAGRLLDIPMRYVSGYLKMDDRDEQEAGHGWAEAHVEGLGWVGFDVSNRLCPDERYVRVATGCDYREAAPVTGIATGTGESAAPQVNITVAAAPAGQQQQQRQGSQVQGQAQGSQGQESQWQQQNPG
jgi:transglutaminase-like putative cysteine protease